jgi:ribosome-interacting GTPase 1
MPANLSPDYLAAEKRFRAARTNEEKMEALEEMLRTIPKHKGTEKLQADIKTRIAKLRRQPKKKGARRGPVYVYPREGAGQIVLVGCTNSGKSALVNTLTKATPEVAAYPFTTREPTLGMMRFEDVALQLVDLPPVSEEHVEPWLFDVVRRADLVWIVLAGTSPLGELETVERLLAERKIRLRPHDAPAPEDLPLGVMELPGLLVVTASDRPQTAENLAILRELVETAWPTVAVSTVSGAGMEALGRETFRALGVLRVYTKLPGKPPDLASPFTLPIGATVGDLAARVHKDFASQVRFARMWGREVFDGQSVQKDHVLADRDVVELHM